MTVIVVVSRISSATEDLDELAYKSVDLKEPARVSSVLMLSNSLSSCRVNDASSQVSTRLEMLVSIVIRELRADK